MLIQPPQKENENSAQKNPKIDRTLDIKQALKQLNSLGLLPKEGEDAQAFLKRACALESKTHLGLARCKQLFDAEPTWVEVIEEQKGLKSWQGAVMWIQEDEQGNT